MPWDDVASSSPSCGRRHQRVEASPQSRQKAVEQMQSIIIYSRLHRERLIPAFEGLDAIPPSVRRLA